MNFDGQVGSIGVQKSSVTQYRIGIRGRVEDLNSLKSFIVDRAVARGVEVIGQVEVEGKGKGEVEVSVMVRSTKGIV